METQLLLNVLFGVVSFACAWWINTMWVMTRSLQEQVSQLNIKLAENYAPRQETEKSFVRLFDTLDEMRKEIAHISRNQTQARTTQEILKEMR